MAREGVRLCLSVAMQVYQRWGAQAMPAKAKQQSARGGRDCGWPEIRPGFGGGAIIAMQHQHQNTQALRGQEDGRLEMRS